MHDAADSVAQRRCTTFLGIWRNIPFALLGLVVIVLFYRSARSAEIGRFAGCG